MEFTSVILLAAALSSPASPMQKPASISYSVSCSSPHAISVRIKNTSGKSIELDRKILPWTDGSKTLNIEGFVVQSGKYRRMLRQGAVFDSFSTEKVTPGATISGTIIMERIFSEYAKAHAEGDIVVYFGLSARGDGRKIFLSRPAMLHIPKGGLFSDGCPTLLELSYEHQ